MQKARLSAFALFFTISFEIRLPSKKSNPWKVPITSSSCTAPPAASKALA